MTNFSSNKKKIITPENSVLLIPIVIGFAVLSTTLVLIYGPLNQKLSNEKAKISELEEKILYIPLYKKYIKDLSINTGRAEKQQERLIELISDPQELVTMLSEINRICIENELEIINVEPQPVIKYNQSKFLNSNINKTNI